MELVYDPKSYHVWKSQVTNNYYAFSIADSELLIRVLSLGVLSEADRSLTAYMFVPDPLDQNVLVLDTSRQIATAAEFIAQSFVPAFIRQQ